MSRVSETLIPPAQRQTAHDVRDALDLSLGDALSKRTGFLIMLVLSAVIAVSGVLSDSTATVIGAMIIAPLGTPILGIAAGLVTGRRSLVVRSLLWVLAGLVIVVVIGFLMSAAVADPADVRTNSQIVGRTAPQLLDLLAALATGTAGAFAMCRKDLSAVLPGVAISISLVPPLGVLGVCVGEGAWSEAFGALMLFLSNVISLVIAGSIVFTLAGYAREPGSSRTANRRRAYAIVTILSLVIAVPLVVNSVVTVTLQHWTAVIRDQTEEWLGGEVPHRVRGIDWAGTRANVELSTEDGRVPDTSELTDELASQLPDFVTVTLHVVPAVSYDVLPED